MPGTSGRSLYERLEGRVPAAAARVIFLTGDTADAETERFLRAAGRPVLTKPIALEPLALALTPLLLSTARRRRSCSPSSRRRGHPVPGGVAPGPPSPR